MAGFPPRRRRRRQILAPEVSSELDAPTREILEAGRRRTLVNFGFVVVGEEFALPLRETVVDPGQADDAGPEAVARLTMVTCLYPTESRDARQPW